MTEPRRWLDPDSDAPDGARELLEHARPTPAADKAAVAVSAAALAKLASAPAGAAALALGGKLAAAASIVALAGAVAVQIAQPAARVRAPAPRSDEHRPDRSMRPAPQPPPAVLPTATKLEPALPPAPSHAENAPPPALAARTVHLPVSAASARAAQRAHPPAGTQPARLAPPSPVAPEPEPALPDPDRLALEVRALDRARAALARDPAAALLEVDRHASRFPDAALAAERELIAVDALQRLGRHDQARARADALLLRYPNSLYRARLRSLLERAK